jgi:pilus assembly protein FimV
MNMKRFLLTLVCCSPLLFSPSSSFSLNLIGPNDQEVASYGQYGPISEVETLWGISTIVRPDSSLSIQQTLVAIYKLNPSAFYQGNINKLLPGTIIQVPTYEFVQQQTAQEAIALINKYSNPKKAAAKVVVPEKKSAASFGFFKKMSEKFPEISVVSI